MISHLSNIPYQFRINLVMNKDTSCNKQSCCLFCLLQYFPYFPIFIYKFSALLETSRYYNCYVQVKNGVSSLYTAHRVIIIFFYLGFFSLKFTIHRTAEEGGGYFFNPSLPFSPASQTLRYWQGKYCRKLTSAQNQQPDSSREPLVPERKPLTTKLSALDFFGESSASLSLILNKYGNIILADNLRL